MSDGVPRTRSASPRTSRNPSNTISTSAVPGPEPLLLGESSNVVRLQPRQKGLHRFPVSERSQAFRRRFFPNASAIDWNDWRWQARNRIRNLEQLARVFELSPDERSAVERHTGSL